jgi:hypothetical protein
VNRVKVIVPKIPKHIYERVHEFALLITNATLAEDDVLCETHYAAFRDYYEEQSRVGRCHPFILETLADYTEEEALAMSYYEQALALAKQMGEPIHSILIAIGERHQDAKRFEVAEAYLRDGRDEARRRGDSEMAEEADRLLRDIEY